MHINKWYNITGHHVTPHFGAKEKLIPLLKLVTSETIVCKCYLHKINSPNQERSPYKEISPYQEGSPYKERSPSKEISPEKGCLHT